VSLKKETSMKHSCKSNLWVALTLGTLVLATHAEAQTWPRYAVTKLADVIGPDGKALAGLPKAVNSNGVVVGSYGKPAGTKTVYNMTFNGIGLPNIFGPYERSVVQTYDTYPVQWTNGQAKLLPRVSGLYNTFAQDIGDDGAVLVQVADASGRAKDGPYAYSRTKSHWRLYQGATFKTPTIAGNRISATGYLQDKKVYLASGGELVVNTADVMQPGTQITVWAKGEASTVQVPQTDPAGGVIKAAILKGLWADGVGWLQTQSYRYDNTLQTTVVDHSCWLGKSGAFAPIASTTRSGGFKCLAVGRDGLAFGHTFKSVTTYDGAGTASSYLTADAYYMVKDDVWTRVDTSLQFREAIAMNDKGMVVGIASEASTAPADSAVVRKSHLVGVQGGQVKILDELVDTPLDASRDMLIVDFSEKGHLLISQLAPSRLNYYVLTPR
jgi:hypothetical protein